MTRSEQRDDSPSSGHDMCQPPAKEGPLVAGSERAGEAISLLLRTPTPYEGGSPLFLCSSPASSCYILSVCPSRVSLSLSGGGDRDELSTGTYPGSLTSHETPRLLCPLEGESSLSG